MKNYQSQHYTAYYIMLSDGSSIKCSRRDCFASAGIVNADNPFMQRWYYSPDGKLAIRLPRNELGERLGKENAAALKSEERASERPNLCTARTSAASCAVTCDTCPHREYCESPHRATNGADCKCKCDCCRVYMRRALDLDTPLGYNEDGSEVLSELQDEQSDVETAHIADERKADIAAVIAALDPIDRVLWDCLVNQITKADIADKLHMTVDGVYYRQKRLEKLLRENEVLKNIFENS